MCGQNVVTRVVCNRTNESPAPAQQPRVPSRSNQNLSCSERVQPPQNNTAEVPASSRGAVHHLRRHAYKQREPVSRVEIDGDEMREPSGAGLRKSLYSQRMLPACRHLWRRQRPALASVPRRGKAHSAPSPLGDGAAGRAWITIRASAHSERWPQLI